MLIWILAASIGIVALMQSTIFMNVFYGRRRDETEQTDQEQPTIDASQVDTSQLNEEQVVSQPLLQKESPSNDKKRVEALDHMEEAIKKDR